MTGQPTAKKFGFCDIEPVRKFTGGLGLCYQIHYESFGAGVQNLGGHLYYASRGDCNAQSGKKRGK